MPAALLAAMLALAPVGDDYDHAEQTALRCGACHPGAPAPLPSPVLDGVARRRTADFLRRYLTDPAAARPGTAKPDLIPDAHRARHVEALVQFLAAEGRADAPAARAVHASEIERGRQLYHGLGCAACHAPFEQAESLAQPIWSFDELAPAESPGAGLDGVLLGDARRDWTADGLVAYLRDPLASHPDGRMPSLDLDANEARSIATYLRFESAVADGGLDWRRAPGLHYEYFEGGFPESGPDWESMEPAARGTVPGFDELPDHAEDWFGFRLRGMVVVPERGRWRFSVTSDDGSMLWLDGELLIDNGGAHGARRVEGERFLEAGPHALDATWYELTGEIAFEVTWEGPGTPEGPIPALALEHWTLDLAPVPDPFAPDAALAEEGRALYARLGCAACHPRAGVDPPPPASALPAVAEPNAATRLADALERLRCNACHARGGRGGPEGARRALFTAAVDVDLGDHGRYPPPLEGAGAKLTTAWMDAILVGGERARPYVRTRMPIYGAANVAGLAGLFTAVDAPEPETEPEVTLQMAEIGRQLAAADGLGCVQCHAYDGHEPPGGPAVDLVAAAERVRPAWFREMLLDPAAVGMEARMPTMWQDGRSPVPDVLGGDPARQTDATWAWLVRGASLPLPDGLIVEDAEFDVLVGDEPRLVGVFMDGVSPRTLAVGTPEGLHFAFDVQASRLAKAWRGRFLNAKGTWFARAGQLERPASPDVLDLPPGPPLARLATSDAPWPDETGRAAGYRALGRRFDAERRPVFRYAVGAVEVEELVRPELHADGQRLVRELTLRSAAPPADLWFRAAVGARVRAEVLEGDAPVPVDGERGRELRVPVRFAHGAARVVVEVAW